MQSKFTFKTRAKNQNISALDVFAYLVKRHPFLMGGAWLSVFGILLCISWIAGVVPKLETSNASAALVEEEGATESSVKAVASGDDTPFRIIIDAIDVDTEIIQPASRDIEDLDAALMEGVVHYPGSGELEDTSNMFLLGHSTGFRVVNNQAYKVFNDLKHLKANDIIRIQSDGKEYLYRVKEMDLVNAEETSINLRSDVKMLTLATCNVFGAKEERYVVSAEFVGSYEINEEELDL